ncbi:hypothetical protein ACP4OV_024450 [Aristida adscensionis]
MASMITGDLAEAYVLKNACKEKVRRMAEEKAAVDGEAGAADGASGKKTTAEEAAGSKGEGSGGLFGLVKKKVHPKVDGTRSASS